MANLRDRIWLPLSALLLLAAPVRAAEDDTAKAMKSFLTAHCIRCHGPEKQLGEVRLDDLPADPTRAVERWAAVRDQIRDGLMPPAKEPRPDAAQVRSLTTALTLKLGAKAARLPNQGNLIPHELLFGTPGEPNEPASPARLWRMTPENYNAFVAMVLGGKVGGNNRGMPSLAGLIQPFVLTGERGIRNFSGLYSIDEPSTQVLIRNAAAIVEVQTGPRKPQTNPIAELVAVVNTPKPTAKQLEVAVQKQFQLAIGRTASADEVARYLALYEKCAKEGDTAGAAKTMLQAVLLKSDAIFRMELGTGTADSRGRRMLAPPELAQAISLTLGQRRDKPLFEAANKGDLTTREQVAAHVKRMLNDPTADTSRILTFFHEYFEYNKADEVFKEKPKDFVHSASTLVGDTDYLIRHILAEDTDVFRRLLTTEDSFANYALKKDKSGKEMPGPANVPNNKDQRQVESVYGLEQWPEQQPVRLPENTRIGILMQPSWLVAWSTNFDNDPVRRGRWIRERLLGGTVPDLPIGVAAQVPEDHNRTFRDRLTVTREARCWKCHQKMDELGLPFEQFDHFGRFRTTEDVPDPTAPPLKNQKGQILRPGMKSLPLDTTGKITDTGVARLDGPVKDPREMLRKIADSDLARQVFIRHVFRFFLGRNERLSDARALQEADRAYLGSGGSFKALIVSILTSDPFLYRTGGGQ